MFGTRYAEGFTAGADGNFPGAYANSGANGMYRAFLFLDDDLNDLPYSHLLFLFTTNEINNSFS